MHLQDTSFRHDKDCKTTRILVHVAWKNLLMSSIYAIYAMDVDDTTIGYTWGYLSDVVVMKTNERIKVTSSVLWLTIIPELVFLCVWWVTGCFYSTDKSHKSDQILGLHQSNYNQR